MNNQRRKQIKLIQIQLQSVQSSLEEVRDEEESYRTNMVESIFNGEKGMIACQNVDDIDYCINSIDDVLNTLQNVIDRKHMD